MMEPIETMNKAGRWRVRRVVLAGLAFVVLTMLMTAFFQWIGNS